MIKVLYLPIGSQPGMADGFRNVGVELKVFDFFSVGERSKEEANRTFLNHISSFRPDLIHMQLQMTDVITDQSLIKAREILPEAIFTNWTGDIRKTPNMEFVKKSKLVNYSLMSNVGQIEQYRQAGCKNVLYWQIGYDPKACFPKWNDSFDYDVVFVGNCYRDSMFPDARLRTRIAAKLKEVFKNRCGIFGGGYPSSIKANSIGWNEANNVYNRSLCVLSVSNFNDISHYFSDRLLMCLATARPTITYRFPGIESYFAENGDILVARNIDEVVDLVNFCKSNINKANQIGKNGFMRVSAEHSFTSRALELLSITKLI